MSEVDRRVTITVEQVTNGSTIWEENDNTWTTNRVRIPYLVAIYEKGEAAIPNYQADINNGGWDPATLAFPAKIGKVLEIIWQNDNGKSGGWGVHPSTHTAAIIGMLAMERDL
jgi:L-ascorbate oxidase